MNDGSVINGESLIGKPHGSSRIKEVYITPELPKPVDGVISAIREADIIVLGPGSLYTSIIPNLLVDGVADAIRHSTAKKIYVCNIMTQPGETDDYTASMHLDAIEKHSYPGIADAVIVNASPLPDELARLYAEQNAYEVVTDTEILKTKAEVIPGRLLIANNDKIRHNFNRLARIIMNFRKGD